MINKIIDNYKIIEEIGRGGMGIVYKAEDLTLEKIVALKMVDPLLASDERFLRRFRAEAKALARLEDPNIITVHAFRETPDGVFMVMRHVDGATIAEMIADHGALPYRQVVALAKQILNGLSHAQDSGIIHRDIKPANIMITHDGVVKVMDFGLAKMQRGVDSTVTSRGMGTLKYMSPEQVERPDSLDHRTDIYSVGMTLYEMLAGETPFRDASTTDFSIMKAIVEQEFPVPAKHNPDVPRQLSKIVMKALEKQPEARYQSAAEMVKDLKRFERFDRLNLVSRTTAFIREQKEQTPSPAPKAKTPHGPPPATIPAMVKKLKKYRTPLALSIAAILGLIVFFSLVGKRQQESALPARPDESLQVELKPVGNLALNVTPAATELTIDGQPFGAIASRTNLQLPEGDHLVQLSLDGYRTVLRTIHVAVEKPVILDHDMQPVAHVSIVVTPPDAIVKIDGAIIKAPEEAIELTPGPHNLRISKTGYETVNKQFVPRQGTMETITETLAKRAPVIKWTDVFIDSAPQGAEVFVDGKFLGTTPLTASRLQYGWRQIQLEKKGFSRHSESIKLPGGRSYFATLESKPKVTVRLRAVDASGARMAVRIRIDGRKTGITTPYALDIPVNTPYTIEALKGGYHAVRRSLSFTKDITLEFVMHPDPANLTKRR